jgi:hypothetical protein
MSSERDAVVRAAAHTVHAARGIVPAYAGRHAPARTDQVAALLRGAGCWVEEYPFLSGAAAMALPRCAGVYPVLLNRAADRTARGFALRHELAHVLAGEADGAVFLADAGPDSASERAADLFALADLVPGWWLAWLHEEALSAAEVRGEVVEAVRGWAEGWSRRRVRDRAVLRMRLWEVVGI